MTTKSVKKSVIKCNICPNETLISEELTSEFLEYFIALPNDFHICGECVEVIIELRNNRKKKYK